MMHRESPNELDWSAFCYAAGEMTAAEAEAFETRLAGDQGAREALARAVELTQAVATAESLEPVVAIRTQSSKWTRPSRWTRRLGWMALGSAASLLVALLWSGAGSWFGNLAPAASDQSQLAAAWTQTHQEMAESDSELSYAKHVSASELAASEPADPSESSLNSIDDDPLESVTPDWLTAAVETYPGQPTDADSTPFDSDRREN